MTRADELARALEAIADAFDALAVRWVIGGSLASSAHGEPRATNDVDVIAALAVPQATKLAAALAADFHADVDVMIEAVRSRGSFNVIDTRSFIKIDVFVPAPGPLGLGQLDRRVQIELLPGLRALPVLAAEDVILQKLRWYSIGGCVSDRQWRDILSVLRAAGPALDHAYLDSVATGGGLQELLARARREAGGP